MDADLLGPAHAGERLGVTSQQVRTYIKQGRLPAITTSIGQVIPRGAVDALAKQREQQRLNAKQRK